MHDIVIIGGGLSGAAVSCHLAGAGRSVALIERSPGAADKVCGEFLSREAQLHLRRLGLDPRSLGGHAITHLRLVRNDMIVRSALPFTGIGLSRRTLDEALLQHAASCGVTLHRGQPARLQRGEVVLPDAAVTHRGPVLLASGKHDIPGVARARVARSDLVGFKTYFTLSASQTAALAGHVEVILFAGGYAGLQLVEGGRANLCLLVRRGRLQQVGGSWDALLEDLCAGVAHLRSRLDGARPMLPRPLAIAGVPYGFVHAAAEDGVFRLGDQMAVIDSFSGDGMSIALQSAGLAAGAIIAGQSAAAYHRQMRADIGAQIGRARALYHFGQERPGLLMGLARLWPGGLRLAARLTRVPERALARGLA